MKIQQKLAHRTNYGASRSVATIKYIVIHYTANDGDKAWNNANYFQTALPSGKKASAHYFVDDNYVYQSVPDNYVAYSVGAKTADKSKGGGKYFTMCTNANSLNIELCDTNKNGSIYPTNATINLALDLTRYLMNKYNIDVDHVIRHFDVTGKECPKYWVKDAKWKSEFKNKLTVIFEPAFKEGWVEDEKGWWYRYSDGSYPKSKWVTIGGKDYYFNSEGYMASKEYIKASDYATSKKLYWVGVDGAWNGKEYTWKQDAKGWWIAEIGGRWYAKNEWAMIDGKWYYFDDTGYMVANRIKTIDGNVCQFREDGTLI